jgi:hypothetical protein
MPPLVVMAPSRAQIDGVHAGCNKKGETENVLLHPV